jgi:PAS domain S-box-containing protein
MNAQVQESERAQATTESWLEGRWRRVFENSAIGIALTDLQGRFLSANTAYQKILGYSEDELRQLTFLDVTHEEDRDTNQALIVELLKDDRQQFQIEKRYRRKDGRIIWVSNNVAQVPGDANSPRCLMAICEEITARKWAEAVLAGEKRVLEMIAGGKSLCSILEALCGVVEEISGSASCSILVLDQRSNRLCHGAAPGLPNSYSAALDGSAIGPQTGPCGRAAFHKKPVFVSDIASETVGQRYRDLALAHGLRACWSAPILSSESKVLGTFAIYSREPRTPSPQHRTVIERFAHLASIAIEAARAEDALRRSEAYLTEAQRLSHTGSFGWSVSSGEIAWSKETFSILGYEPSERPTLDLVLKRVHPADVLLVRQMIERATREGTDFDFEHRMLMPDGAVKYVHVVAHAAKGGSGEVEFVGAVMDITDRKLSQEALRAAKARFEGIVEIAEDAIISIDSGQRILLFNKGAEKVFGYTAAEVSGKPLDALLPQRFTEAHRAHIHEFAESRDVSRLMAQRREVFGRRKDGSEFPAEASISKLQLGTQVVFTVILRDITERKQAAEALRSSAQLARGQTEALRKTLDAMAMESAPDRLVEHVLRTVIEQLNAHSTAVWLRSETTGLVSFEIAFENGQLVTKSDAELAKISPTFSIDEVWPWPQVFRTGKPSVLEDIREGPSFPWRDHVLSLGVVTVLIVPMLVAGQVEGVIGIRFTSKRSFRTEETELAQALANQAMLAIQLMRLSQQSRQAAVAAERNRLARDIHDTLAQGFTGVIVQLEAAEDAISEGLVKEASKHMAHAGELARGSLQEARRSVRALRPQALEDKALSAAIEELLNKMTTGTGLKATLGVQGEPVDFSPVWGENLLRIGQEVLTNSLRHASASEFKALLSFEPNEVRLILRDNGRGFDPASAHDGFGLLGIRERVQGMGGRLNIQSASGEGTTISIVLPHANASQSVEK